MKKNVFITSLLVLFILILISTAIGKFKSDIINKVAIANTDIPEGFTIGKIPGPVKKTLKGNPWLMDRRAIKKLTKRIYPGGDFTCISDIHVTIMAELKKPYGDDIVCYILLFNDSAKTKNEIKKISDYVGYNKDRAILLVKDNLVIFLHVDDVENFHHLNRIAMNIRGKLKKI